MKTVAPSRTSTSPSRISAPKLLAELASESTSPALWDVRTDREWQAEHCPSATHVPLALLSRHAPQLVELLDKPVVLLCHSGQRSETAAQQLLAAGAEKVSVLDDGLTAFREAGAASIRGRSLWSMERQVRFTAGLLLLTGTLGSLVIPWLFWLTVVIGAGLTFSAVTNTCGMARALALLPFNRSQNVTTLAQVLAQVESSSGGRAELTESSLATLVADPPRAKPSS